MRLVFLITLLSVLPVFSGCKKGKNNTESCNGKSTRREVKLCTDDAASEIDTTPISIGVEEIGLLDVPEINSD